MFDEKPCWTFVSRRALTQWYGHVHLLEQRVLGQWLCLDRSDGRLVWQRRFFRPNTVCGIDADVVVATERRSDGPWTADFGCYGISLATGKLLWTSHGRGLWGRVLRLLDFVPGFTNDLRNSPQHVANGECVCHTGRVIDFRTGKTVRTIPREQVGTLSSEAELSSSERLHEEGRVQVSEDGSWLCNHTRQPDGSLRFEHGQLRLSRLAPDGTTRWDLDVRSLGYPGGYHYQHPFLYLTISEEDNRRPHPTKAHYVLPNPTFYRLVTLDVHTGQVVQNIRLNEEKVAECRIEDADEAGLLISMEERQLRYYAICK